MSRSTSRLTLVVAALAALGVAAAVWAQGAPAPKPTPYGLGRVATAAEIKGWDIDVRGPDGLGLPPGKGTVKQGEEIYLAQCASCHGEFGEGAGRWPELMGGGGTLKDEDPRKTIGSYWPHAPTVFDYVRRSMPFTMPQSLSDDETYAVVAYLLHINDLLPETATLDATALRAIRMPNRDGFLQGDDPRPDVKADLCMKDCKTGDIRVTSDLAKRLGVTPKRTGD